MDRDPHAQTEGGGASDVARGGRRDDVRRVARKPARRPVRADDGRERHVARAPHRQQQRVQLQQQPALQQEQQQKPVPTCAREGCSFEDSYAEEDFTCDGRSKGKIQEEEIQSSSVDLLGL